MTRENFISGSIYAIYLLIGVLSTYIASLTSIVMAIIVIVIEYIRLIGLLTKVYKVVGIIFIVNVGLVAYNGYKNELLLTKQTEVLDSKNNLTETYLKKSWVKASTFKELVEQMRVEDSLPVDYRVLTALYIALEIALLMLVFELGKRVSTLPISAKTTYDTYQELKKANNITSHSEFIRIIKSPKILGGNWETISKLTRNITNTGARPSIAYELTDDEIEKIKKYFTENKRLGE